MATTRGKPNRKELEFRHKRVEGDKIDGSKDWTDDNKESFCGIFGGENNAKYILSVSRLDGKIFLASDKTLITLKYE